MDPCGIVGLRIGVFQEEVVLVMGRPAAGHRSGISPAGRDPRCHLCHIEGHFRDLFSVHFSRKPFRKMGTMCHTCHGFRFAVCRIFARLSRFRAGPVLVACSENGICPTNIFIVNHRTGCLVITSWRDPNSI